MSVDGLHISLMELNDIQEAANVLSVAMLNNPIHIAVFKGNGERERLEIERMFLELFHDFPAITFLARDDKKIVGVMRMKSCAGRKTPDESKKQEDVNDIHFRKMIWHREWAARDPVEQHWHLGPIGVLPSFRKMGIGSRFMDIFCTEVDKCSAKAYLETDLDENVRFYQKFGFEVVSNSNIFQVKNHYMTRVQRT